ncbi:MAG: aminopeptidase P family protein [Pseudorhodobacter sp.]
MFQDFESHATPEQGPPRLQKLRQRLREAGIDGFIVPRADAHQGEYVAPCDERLQWLTGFTGSAGFCIILPDIAGVFIDGRYRVQVKSQVDLTAFTPVHWPETRPGSWIAENLASGKVGYDAWLHTAEEIDRLEVSLENSDVTLCDTDNFLDFIWADRPDPPMAAAFSQPDHLAGRSAHEKRADLADLLAKAGQKAAIITLPDSLCWLLNIRGADIARNPVVQGFAILHDDGRVEVFAEERKFGPDIRNALGTEVSFHPMAQFLPALRNLAGPVRVDRGTAPLAVSQALKAAGIAVEWGDDPCRLPKARKTPAEIAATRQAHLRDGAAMVEFLCWLDREAPKGGLTEIAVVQALEGFRRDTNQLRDISFDTICGAGEHGAIVHYRVTRQTDRPVRQGELLLVDSGGQYVDGTTDITRTIAIGKTGEEEAECYTRVLQGMIAMSRARWPKGLAGRDLDALARAPLWQTGRDYDHGTGHGVGAFLSVHEGPQRLSRISQVALEPGMILSNEPGYYREGAFGIRIENLIVVTEAPALPGGDTHRTQLCFETLSFVPLDRRLIATKLLSNEERAWVDTYHAETRAKLSKNLSAEAAHWLEKATAPL